MEEARSTYSSTQWQLIIGRGRLPARRASTVVLLLVRNLVPRLRSYARFADRRRRGPPGGQPGPARLRRAGAPGPRAGRDGQPDRGRPPAGGRPGGVRRHAAGDRERGGGARAGAAAPASAACPAARWWCSSATTARTGWRRPPRWRPAARWPRGCPVPSRAACLALRFGRTHREDPGRHAAGELRAVRGAGRPLDLRAAAGGRAGHRVGAGDAPGFARRRGRGADQELGGAGGAGAGQPAQPRAGRVPGQQRLADRVAEQAGHRRHAQADGGTGEPVDHPAGRGDARPRPLQAGQRPLRARQGGRGAGRGGRGVAVVPAGERLRRSLRRRGAAGAAPGHHRGGRGRGWPSGSAARSPRSGSPASSG